MIPMRDGVKLQTAIFTPKRATGPLPMLFRRTPYGVAENEAGLHSGIFDNLIADGYISTTGASGYLASRTTRCW